MRKTPKPHDTLFKIAPKSATDLRASAKAKQREADRKAFLAALRSQREGS